MKIFNRRLITILILLAAGLNYNCSSKKINTENNLKEIKPDNLTKFFSICEKDIQKAINVIIEKNLIEYLTHFQIMNNGGKKYYLLEREAITEMIKSVTQGMYEDFILINKSGAVVYTMRNELLFASNIKSTFMEQPIKECFQKSAEDIYISGITVFPKNTNNHNLFLSARIISNNEVQGIFILQVNIDKIIELMEGNTFIIGYDGQYKISREKYVIFNPFPHFNLIDKKNLENHKTYTFAIENKNYTYYPFSYKNISWIIISENSLLYPGSFHVHH